MADEQTISEQRRAAKRMRVLKSGKIVLDGRSIDCTLRDMSQTGAKLVCAEALNMPDSFRLFIALDNTIRDVRIAWKEKGMVGVTFASEPKSAALRKF